MRMTNFTVTAGNTALVEWRTLWSTLFVKYRDGFTNKAPPKQKCEGDNKVLLFACMHSHSPKQKCEGDTKVLLFICMHARSHAVRVVASI